MNKLETTAKKLDIFFKIMKVLCTIAAVSALVGLALIGAYFLFDLKPEQVGTAYHALDLGFLELELAEAYIPSRDHILIIAAVELAMGFAAALLGRFSMGHVRRLLAPMKEGKPFHEAAASSLKKLALLSLVLGVVLNISRLVSQLLTVHWYDLQNLFVGEKIVGVDLHFNVDFTCLVISGILLMLSYIFRYGQELQQLSDETL